MKKLFICLAFAGMFAACGNKSTKPVEEVTDSVAVEVIDSVAVVTDSVEVIDCDTCAE